MCQTELRCHQQATYAEILTHYYPGTNLTASHPLSDP